MVISVRAKTQSETDAGKVKPITQTGLLPGEMPDLRIQLSEALQSSLELNTLLSVYLENVSTAVKLDGIYYSNEDQGVDASIAKQSTHSCGYRLITSEDRLGEIVFKRSKKFTEKELGILESLLSPLICPLRNSLKYTTAVKAAYMDPLTGADNISTLPSTLEREIDLSKRHNQALSVLLIDINHIHMTGDKVLSALARRIMQLCRTTDAVFRYEDDQFLVILHNTNKEGTQVIARRILRSFQKEGLEIPGQLPDQEPLQVSLSLGFSVLTGTDSSTSLLERAAKALGKAKACGGNAIRF
ncbi:MAG: GGDEF domain-containing protein [Gammaproteobacteria bacterium]|nr:GGDEF domain-containing protein [Gammaproteobacteria bacterium]